jgi:DNA-binding CsgD family transcriptional regulator
VPVPELSLTEEMVVLLFVAGRTTPEIAVALGLDEKTVEWHVARAAQKLEQAAALHQRVQQRNK